jgi:hypothetical protein
MLFSHIASNDSNANGPRGSPRKPTDPRGPHQKHVNPDKSWQTAASYLAHGCSGPGLVALQGARQHRGPPRTPRTPTDPAGRLPWGPRGTGGATSRSAGTPGHPGEDQRVGVKRRMALYRMAAAVGAVALACLLAVSATCPGALPAGEHLATSSPKKMPPKKRQHGPYSV